MENVEIKNPIKVSGDLIYQLGTENLRRIKKYEEEREIKRQEILKERKKYVEILQSLKRMNDGLTKIDSTEVDVSPIKNIINMFDEDLRNLSKNI